MKGNLQGILLFILLVIVVKMTHGQNRQLIASATLGITSPILDNGLGFYLGINPYLLITPNLAMEGQVSYTKVKISGAFISGRSGFNTNLNTLIGTRLYLNSKEKKIRLYLNLLIGGAYNRMQLNGLDPYKNFEMGYSIGSFVSFDKIIFGLSYENNNPILKIGYDFN